MDVGGNKIEDGSCGKCRRSYFHYAKAPYTGKQGVCHVSHCHAEVEFHAWHKDVARGRQVAAGVVAGNHHVNAKEAAICSSDNVAQNLLQVLADIVQQLCRNHGGDFCKDFVVRGYEVTTIGRVPGIEKTGITVETDRAGAVGMEKHGEIGHLVMSRFEHH